MKEESSVKESGSEGRQRSHTQMRSHCLCPASTCLQSLGSGISSSVTGPRPPACVWKAAAGACRPSTCSQPSVCSLVLANHRTNVHRRLVVPVVRAIASSPAAPVQGARRMRQALCKTTASLACLVAAPLTESATVHSLLSTTATSCVRRRACRLQMGASSLRRRCS